MCPKCKIYPVRLNGRYCKKCHAKYMRTWRKINPLSHEQRKKDNCRSYAYVYLKRGKIQRESCEICGSIAQMHHDNYDKPLDIRWLCRNHHLIFHQS